MRIELTNISKRYRKELIFRNVSLELNTRACCAITGTNGSGKSTLLQIVSGFLSPTEGAIHWHMEEKKIEYDQIYRYISLCAPSLQLWDELTLRENIALFCRFKKLPSCSEESEFARVVLLENEIDRPLKTFSSGMKQRVKLGLAILSDTPCLLLDEPCSHLDSAGVLWYKDLLEKHKANRTVVIASNNDEREIGMCTQRIDVNDYKRQT